MDEERFLACRDVYSIYHSARPWQAIMNEHDRQELLASVLPAQRGSVYRRVMFAGLRLSVGRGVPRGFIVFK